MNEIIEVDPRQQNLKTIGHISYFLHAVVAVGAVLPGVQAQRAAAADRLRPRPVQARRRARARWQESHFSWRIRSVLWAGGLYLITAPLWLLLLVPGLDRLGAHLDLVPLPRSSRGWLNLSSNTPMPA